MATNLTRSQWATLIDRAGDAPTFGEIVAAIEEVNMIEVDDAEQLVKNTLDAGDLVEDTDAGMFAEIRLPENGETSKTADSEGEGPESTGADPGGEAVESTGQHAEDGDFGNSWGDADFLTPDSGVYPHPHHDVEQWMGRLAGEKMPFSPWASKDHPEAEPEEDARFKWGLRENYTDGDTVAMAEDDPRLDGRVFIQREDDPFAFVDGDDVRCPETGEVHPAFIAILQHLGMTYADISTSGGGVHAYYKGELPIEGKGQATFDIDTEPWGANDSPPAVEIYANKHVCVATGEHVPGTPTTTAEWDEEVLRAILIANGYEDKDPVEHDTDHDRLADYEPTTTSPTETADDMRDIYAAVDRLTPRDLPLNTSQTGEDSTGWSTWNPSYRSSSSGESLHYNGEGAFHDHKEGEAFGVLSLFAAEQGIISNPWDRLAGSDYFEAIDAAREGGARVPEPPEDERKISYRDDPRELSATVDARRAWEAAARVTPDDLDKPLDIDTAPDGEAWLDARGERISDVVRAVALDTGLIADSDDDLDDYPAAYNQARTEYGAPLPRYYTTADAIAEFNAVLDVIGEVTFWNFDTDVFNSQITAEGEEVDGEAVRALNPAWRESESGESVVVFENGTIWDADSERVVDPLRFVALDSGLINDPADTLQGSDFTTAYGLCRTEYGAPLPRWEPAEDGAREITPQLPPSDELVDTFDLDGVATDELDDARAEVEAMIGDLTSDADRPRVLTSLPATGKTTGTIKTARERPLSYLAPRKELQKQALDKAERWNVDGEVLPVFSDEQVRDEILDAAVSHVRERGKDRLRDRWAVLAAAFEAISNDEDAADDLDPSDLFAESDEDDVDLDRPTCETADGEHGVAWALAVHIARRLGYTPREIHTQARGLFGAELPCSHGDGETCEYSDGWDAVSDPDNCPDLLVGSYVHAHVESVRTAYSRGRGDEVERSTRALVLDEFPGEAFVREFDDEAFDFATWLAASLRDDVEDRRDMYDADLAGDDWVRAWLDGEADEVVDDAIAALGRTKDLLDARQASDEILSEVDREVLDALGIGDAIEEVTNDTDATEAFDQLSAAINAVDRNQPAAGIASWADDAVREPLARATAEGRAEPNLDAVENDTLPTEGDLAELLDRAVEAADQGEAEAAATVEAALTALRGGSEGCRRLAAWADDGYAHPDAHHLLTAVITPTADESGAKRIHTSNWAFDPDATDGTVLDVVQTNERDRVVADRNDHGALLHTPPLRVNGSGEESPLVGLDATGRAELWSTALGEDVETADIHTTPRERAEFLQNALSLRVIQAADRPRPYEGDPTTKDTDGDVALLESLAEEYSGIQAPRHRGEEPVEIGRPAAITTKGVREVLENDSRLDDVVAAWENYGNHTGANDLGDHRLAAILGSQHYGDHAIERFCALAGEEVDTSRRGGRGAALDYGNDLANTYLKHMSEDQTMQAILRFARGDSGATVVARTSALREDLPVVGRGQVVETWNDTATTIAREYRRLGGEFTAADVRDAVDVTPRQVRRVLAELVEAGYLQRASSEAGKANVYEPAADAPGAGEVELPDRITAEPGEAGQSPHNQYYTWNVRVSGRELVENWSYPPTAIRELGAPPSPAAAGGIDPPE